MRLLIVDDDADLVRLIGCAARVLWPDCTLLSAADGAAALRQFAEHRPDLVILDIMMPSPDGFEVCRRIRESGSNVPILMLTARDTMLDEVRALDLGADDYLTKPFDHLKLLARLRALARRADLAPISTGGSAQERRGLMVSDLAIDLAARRVTVRGNPIELTPTEYVLLITLAADVGQLVPHRTLLERVWGADYARDTHYLKVFVNRLRQKLGDDASRPRYIETRRNVGYRLVAAR
jgi:two-component system KDP operon response regulator KdpE